MNRLFSNLIFLLILFLCFASISEASLNRLTSIQFPDTTQNMSYTYDSTGKVLSMTDPSGTTAYSYNNGNRLTKETKTIEGKAFVVSYVYSLSGALTSITYPSGRVVSYEYDPIGRIIRVMEEKDGKRSEIIKSIAYLPNGAVSSITQGNGIVTAQGYDVNGALNSLNIGNLKKLTYTRDGVGNITAINDVLDSTKTKTYVYDALYRLTNAAGPWGTLQYNYDSLGNRLKETHNSDITDYSYQNNKLISSSGAKAFNFTYDNNGNTVAENQKQYTYNQNQRLIKAVENEKTLGEYLYNGNGQRIKKVADSRTTYFVYDQMGNLIAEMDGEGLVIADYIYLGSVPIARIDEWWEGMKLPEAPTGLNITPADKQLSVNWNPNTDTGTDTVVDGYKVYWGTASKQYTNSVDVGKTTSYAITGLTNGTTYYVSVTAYADLKEMYYYHTDHLGTPILMTDKNGSKVWNGEFLPFGEDYSITGNVINNFRFPGQYADKETGLNQNWQRDYHPPSGTYRQSDPIGFLGGDVNLYSYVGNNVINLIDPEGLETYVCRKPLDYLTGKGWENLGTKSGWDVWFNPFYHKYLCVKDGKTTVCGGQSSGGAPIGAGQQSEDKFVSERCEKVESDNQCMEDCLKWKFDQKRPYYTVIGPGTNCKEWADQKLRECRRQCRGKREKNK